MTKRLGRGPSGAGEGSPLPAGTWRGPAEGRRDRSRDPRSRGGAQTSSARRGGGAAPETITEFDLIRLFTRGLPGAGEGVVLGVGDDAAVLRPPRGEDLVATVDAVVEDVHFRRGWAPEDIGWKSLAVNLSDLAAMGARPLWALVALALPRGEDPAFLARVARGLGRCARRHRVAVAGGNVTRASELSLTVTVAGAVPRGAALTRAGAAPGDRLFVSGTLGEAALGLAPGADPRLARRQRRPEPRLALGAALRGVASAAIDVSDGLLQDLGHLCRASGVGARVELARLPRSPAARRAAARLADPEAPFLAGGEDYELCFAVPRRQLARVGGAAAAARTRVTEVGEVVRARGVKVLSPDGAAWRAPRGGHDHLAPRRARV